MFRVKLFKLPTPKAFRYTPRFYNGTKGKNIYKIKSKYSKEENDIELNYNDYKNQWTADRKLMRNTGNFQINRRLIIIAIVLILIFLYLMDFDLSFFKKN